MLDEGLVWLAAFELRWVFILPFVLRVIAWSGFLLVGYGGKEVIGMKRLRKGWRQISPVECDIIDVVGY